MRRRLAVGLLACTSLVLLLWLSPPVSATRTLLSVRTTKLTGDDAQNFLRSDKNSSRFAAAQRRSAIRQERRGHTRADTQVVFVLHKTYRPQATSLLAQLVESAFPGLAAQEFEAYDGYGVFSSWTDDDDTTWEGNIFVFQDSTGRSTSIDAQIYINDYELEEEDVLSGEGEMEGGPEDPPILYPMSADVVLEFGRLIKASATTLPRARSVGSAREGCPCYLLEQANGALARCMLREAAKDSAATCAAALFGCWFAGPAWPECVGTVCSIQMVEQLIEEMIDFWERCLTLGLLSPQAKVAS